MLHPPHHAPLQESTPATSHCLQVYTLKLVLLKPRGRSIRQATHLNIYRTLPIYIIRNQERIYEFPMASIHELIHWQCTLTQDLGFNVSAWTPKSGISDLTNCQIIAWTQRWLKFMTSNWTSLPFCAVGISKLWPVGQIWTVIFFGIVHKLRIVFQFF